MEWIEFSTEAEWRLIPFRKDESNHTVTKRYQSSHRFIFRGKHASDRDFKQLEFAAALEYQPLLAPFRRSRGARYQVSYDPIYGDDEVYTFKDFGWQLLPKLGFELGRTYHRDEPAEAIEVSDTLRRFYAGLELRLELGPHAVFELDEVFYIRGENPENRKKNYFDVELNVPLGRLASQTSHGFFVSFTRGNKPPFSSPDVNAVSIGYRLRSQGWFGLSR